MAALKFNERRQGDNDTFDSFVTDLKILVKDCGYQEEERMVRDAIVFRCKHSKVREKCLDQADVLTCEKAIEVGRNYETNLSSLKKLASDEDPTVNTPIEVGRNYETNLSSLKKLASDEDPIVNTPIEVGRNYETNLSSLKKLASDEDPTVNTLNFRPGIVGSVQIKTKRKTEMTAEAEEVESKHKCRRCGYDKAHKKCPAMGQQCRLCKKMNHFSKLFLSKEVHLVVVDSDQKESEDDSLFVYSVKSSYVPEDEQFYEVIVVEDTEVRFQLDSGAKANVMSLKTYDNLFCHLY